MAVSVIPTLDLERAIAEQGYDVIVGFDEVGRGSLAGPVMVGAAAIWARDLGGFSGVRGGESAGRGESGESGDLDGAEAEAAGGASGAGVAPLEVPKGVADSNTSAKPSSTNLNNGAPHGRSEQPPIRKSTNGVFHTRSAWPHCGHSPKWSASLALAGVNLLESQGLLNHRKR